MRVNLNMYRRHSSIITFFGWFMYSNDEINAAYYKQVEQSISVYTRLGVGNVRKGLLFFCMHKWCTGYTHWVMPHLSPPCEQDVMKK